MSTSGGIPGNNFPGRLGDGRRATPVACFFAAVRGRIASSRCGGGKRPPNAPGEKCFPDVKVRCTSGAPLFCAVASDPLARLWYKIARHNEQWGPGKSQPKGGCTEMARTPEYEVHRRDKNKDENLRGTFVSVLLIGGLILAIWLIVFFLYLRVAL